MNQTNFLPTLELNSKAGNENYTKEDFDFAVVNETHGINMQKLKEYIEVALIIESRNKEIEFIPDPISGQFPFLNKSRILYPMKVCTD